MVAFAIFDFVRSSEGSLDKARMVAVELVRAALTDLDQIEGLDATLNALESPIADRHAAALILGMYEDWARQAAGVLDRIARLGNRPSNIENAPALEKAHGRVCAMLSVSLDDLLSADADIEAGRTIPIEEVRRELRLKAQR